MKKVFVLFLALGFGGMLTAQVRLSPELLWKIGRISDEQVSPDGSKVLFGITNYDLKENKGKRDLYIVEVGTGGGKAGLKSGVIRRLTETDDNEYNARWKPDGSKIGFLSAETGSMQLYEMNPDGSGRTQVSRFDQGISNFAYAPDGKHISFTMDVKLDQTVQDRYPDLPEANARIIDDLMYRHWNTWHDHAYSHVHFAKLENGRVGTPKDIMAGEPYDSPLNPFGGGEQITWDATGTTIVYACKKETGKAYSVSTNSDLYAYNISAGTTTNLTEGMLGYDMEATYSPDGSKMAWLSMERDGFESDKNRIFIMDTKSGKKTDLTEGWDQSAGHLSWSADSRTLYFTSAVNATYQIFKADVKKGDISQVTTGMHNFYSVAEAGDKLVGGMASMSYPKELYTVPKGGDVTTTKPSALTNVNAPILRGVEWGQVRKRMVKATDGKNMLTWVIYPPNFDPNKKYPTLLYCQGGPQSAVSQFFSFRWNFQLMAAKDYIIVAPNRRGLPSFGQEWNDQISGDWGGQAMKDYLSAIDDVAEESYVDEDKLGAVGASYGGYSVYYLAGIHDKRFKAFISHCGLFNLESWYATTEEMFFANWDIKGAPWDHPRPKSYEDFSPHKLVKNWDTPILVIHSEKDFRVPIGEGIQAFNSAQLRGIPSRFLYFPDEGHWVLGPQNGVLWHRVF
ncbi:MAG: S9 family peptidase [Bacteroidota bacterium]